MPGQTPPMSEQELQRKTNELMQRAQSLNKKIKEGLLEQKQQIKGYVDAAKLEQAVIREKVNKEADEEWHGKYDDKGQRISQGLEQMADERIQEGLRGYENFAASLTQVVAICLKLNRALYKSDPVGGLASQTVLAVKQCMAKYAEWNANSSIKKLDKAERNQISSDLEFMKGYVKDLEQQAQSMGIEPEATPPSPRPGN